MKVVLKVLSIVLSGSPGRLQLRTGSTILEFKNPMTKGISKAKGVLTSPPRGNLVRTEC